MSGPDTGNKVMTNPHTSPDRAGSGELLAVTQADREAAAPLFAGAFVASVKAGVCDRDPIVQAFSRHRLSAEKSAHAEGMGVLPSHPRANVRPAYSDTMVDLLDAYEQRIWTWAQGCEVDSIKQRSQTGDSYNESQRDDVSKARSALIRQIDALTTEPTTPNEPRTAGVEALREAVRAEIINTPETADFMAGVPLEAAHQRERWSVDHDAGKTPFDWFWLIGYLAQKAASSQVAGDVEKARHHTISTAAALANWHAQLSGLTTMRPGIGPDNGGDKPGSAHAMAAVLSTGTGGGA